MHVKSRKLISTVIIATIISYAHLSGMESFKDLESIEEYGNHNRIGDFCDEYSIAPDNTFLTLPKNVWMEIIINQIFNEYDPSESLKSIELFASLCKKSHDLINADLMSKIITHKLQDYISFYHTYIKEGCIYIIKLIQNSNENETFMKICARIIAKDLVYNEYVWKKPETIERLSWNSCFSLQEEDGNYFIEYYFENKFALSKKIYDEILQQLNNITPVHFHNTRDALLFSKTNPQYPISIHCSSHDFNNYSAAIYDELKINTSLLILSLYYQQVESNVIFAFAEILKKSTSLQALNLSSNKISFHCAQSIAAALEVNSSLKILKLKNCNINDKSAKVITKALETNTSLQKLDLKNNNIHLRCAKSLEKNLKKNNLQEKADFRHNHNHHRPREYSGKLFDKLILNPFYTCRLILDIISD